MKTENKVMTNQTETPCPFTPEQLQWLRDNLSIQSQKKYETYGRPYYEVSLYLGEDCISCYYQDLMD